MKGVRLVLFLLLTGGAILVTGVLIKVQTQPPFSRSFSPLLQQLGKPIKSVDRAISRLLPIDEIDEKMLGEEIKGRLARNSNPATPDEEATVRYLNALIERLSEESQKPFQYTVFLVGGPPNAFAMPGGIIGVTKSLMKTLENEAELVAILSHEVGHIERGHLFDAARGELLRRKILNISIETYVTEIVNTILNLSFSKTLEDEADEFGFRMLLKKGYDPMAMTASFEKILQAQPTQVRRSTDPWEDFTQTHPYIELRIEKFRSRALHWEMNLPKEKRYLGKKNFKERIPKFETEFSDEI